MTCQMPQMNQQLMDFFSNSETYKKTEKLVESFSEFQQELFTVFWEQLFNHLKQSVNDKDWIVERKTIKLNEGESSITIRHINDANTILSYCILCSKKEACFGVYIEADPNIQNDSLLYNELHNLKIENIDWDKLDYGKSQMPLYKNMNQLNFKNSKVYERFLPNQIDFTVMDISNLVLNGFTEEIKEFIVTKLRNIKIIK
jgi:hypothetical protein